MNVDLVYPVAYKPRINLCRHICRKRQAGTSYLNYDKIIMDHCVCSCTYAEIK